MTPVGKEQPNQMKCIRHEGKEWNSIKLQSPFEEVEYFKTNAYQLC